MALSVTPTDEMKTLTVGEKIYEIVDDQAREDVSEVKADLAQEITSVSEGKLILSKTLTWNNGYIASNGLIRSSTASKFCTVELDEGEMVEIGTSNANITIIGSTTAESVSVGDTVTVIQRTSAKARFETYTYTATAPIKLVLCVNWTDYSVVFYKITDEATRIDILERFAKTGEILITDITSGTWTSTGFLNDLNTRLRLKTFLPVKAGQTIRIKSVTLQHSVGLWKDSVSNASIYRNDTAFVTTDEELVVQYDGYFMITFADKQNTSKVLSVSDYDGKIWQGLSGVYDVPSYYLADRYMSNKASRINTLGKASDDVFVYITDIHWERNAKHSPALIAYLNQRCELEKMFNGGDVADSEAQVEIYKRYRNAINGKTRHVTGNHDWFSPSTGKSLYYIMDSMNNDQIGDANDHYWYVDNVQQKIRYIVLRVFDRLDGGSALTYGYDADQITWLSTVALNLPDGYDAIIFTHFLRLQTTPTDSFLEVETIIDSYNADTSHTGKILAVFQGHTHWDAVYHTTGGLPVITTTCDKYDLSNEPELAQSERVLGTKSEQAFDVVCLNRTAKTFTLVRIGALAQNNEDIYRTDPNFEWVGTLEERVVSYD